LLGNVELQRRFGENAVRLANERFSLEAMTFALLKLYERIVGLRAAGMDALVVEAE